MKLGGLGGGDGVWKRGAPSPYPAHCEWTPTARHYLECVAVCRGSDYQTWRPLGRLCVLETNEGPHLVLVRRLARTWPVGEGEG